MDDDALGFGWFFDDTPHDDAEFTAIENASWSSFVDEAFAGTPDPDFYSVVLHEIGHAMGIGRGDLAARASVPGAGFTFSVAGEDQRLDRDGNPITADLRAFVSSAVSATFTASAGGHLYEGPADPSNPGLPLHPNDLMNDGLNTISPHSDAISRRLISDLNAKLLKPPMDTLLSCPARSTRCTQRSIRSPARFWCRACRT